ncbi:hypothetical protein DFH06DRAFT_527574 [Mycena polygramma]|nr:hypothetical protein DFH06DRAFT_527574 [Mycena polygramma]
MADTLPDEIISEILAPALKVQEHMFANLSSKSPFAKYSVSSSAVLLVCKAWLRVATPLLYNVVVLRSKGQARALQDALRLNRDLGRWIKKLRVEGGLASSMKQVLEYAPNITDIFLSLQIHSSDSSSGLVAGLPQINPTRLIIYDDQNNPLRNKAVVQLMETLESCAPQWTNLNTVVLPYVSLSVLRESFVLKLCAAKTLKTVSIPFPRADMMPHLIQIAQAPSLEAIEIRAKLTKTKSIGLPPTTNPRLKALLAWADNLKLPAVRKYTLTARPPADPTFRPLSTTPQSVTDKIWSRILFFAMLGLELRPKKLIAAQKKMNERAAASKRLRFLLVSKLFHRLGLPYLYRLSVLSTRGLQSFAETLTGTPSLATHIRVLDVRSHWSNASPPPQIFVHTTRLRRLLGERTVLSWAAVRALGESAGGTIEEISGMMFARPEEGDQGAAVLERFTALRVLAWDAAGRAPPVPFFNPAEPVPAAALPALESLTLKTGDTVGVFAQMELPNLRGVFIHVGRNTVKSAKIDFLRAHGAKIQSFRIDGVAVDVGQSALVLCPNMNTLSCRVDHADQYDLGDRGLPAQFQHAYLTKLVLVKHAGPNKSKEEQDWTSFFSTFATAHLPALREVRIPACEWPTAEHAITKSVWVGAAEELLERGIKLTNKTGVEWHPRLKAQGRARKQSSTDPAAVTGV